MVGCEGHKLLGGRLRECACAVASLATQPFEHTADTACVLVLCLMCRQFLLQALVRLIAPFVGNLDRFTAHEEYVYRRDLPRPQHSSHSSQFPQDERRVAPARPTVSVTLPINLP